MLNVEPAGAFENTNNLEERIYLIKMCKDGRFETREIALNTIGNNNRVWVGTVSPVGGWLYESFGGVIPSTSTVMNGSTQVTGSTTFNMAGGCF